MLSAFTQFIDEQQLLPGSAPCLLAVSGGLDSVTMTHLFQQAGRAYAIAHCNFQLRDAESDADEAFVNALAQTHKVPFHHIRFNTSQLAQEAGQSIQLVARELRYQWLEQIRNEQGYLAIATAHHLNDSLETQLYNLAKGCGIRGLHGIPLRSGSVVRPLLFASRQQLADYAAAEDLGYREDRSNASDQYQRNKIRHHIIPILQSINPALEATTAANIQRFQVIEALYHFAIQTLSKQLVKVENGLLQIDLKGLRQQPAPRTLLYELLRPYGFNGDQAADILRHHDSSGQQYFSPTHRLLINREQLLIQQREAAEELTEHWISTADFSLRLDGQRWLRGVRQAKGPEQFPSDPTIAWLDYAALRFPLKLRRWKPGDRFQPLGMKGKRQKLKDFFINQKLSLLDKERVWILESGEEICWVLGYRMDERYKLKEGGGACLRLELLDHGADSAP
ncbi:MAG: tRNA lysidine(34) synthetase TilS [Bacteroidota bacterium]